MKTNDLHAAWLELEAQNRTNGRDYQRLVCIDMLFRVFIGVSGIPSSRYMLLEIPESDAETFVVFSAPQGFTMSIREPIIPHSGYVACVIQSSSHDQNDVFTIVVADILNELKKQKESSKYVATLRKRIEKWKSFFKNSNSKRLSDEKVIGLIGELSCMHDIYVSGFTRVSEMWNGPLRSAQDFQGATTAVEVKTIVGSRFDHVSISSEVQLDDAGKQALYLVVYRIERNDATGLQLSDYVDKVAALLVEEQKSRLYAALTCFGYTRDASSQYTKKYSIREKKVYRVVDGFPRMLRSDLAHGIMNIRYDLALSACSAYEDSFEALSRTIKENENGEG